MLLYAGHVFLAPLKACRSTAAQTACAYLLELDDLRQCDNVANGNAGFVQIKRLASEGQAFRYGMRVYVAAVL